MTHAASHRQAKLVGGQGLTPMLPSATIHALDAIIVGNGVLGLSLGLVLARLGHRVALAGEPHRPFSASAASGAMLGCFGEVTPMTLRGAYGRAKLNLDVKASQLWDAWLTELGEDAGQETTRAIRTAFGTIVLHNTIGVPEIDDASMQSIRQALDMYGEAYESIDPSSLDWLDPQPTARPLEVLFIPGEHAVNSAALLDALEEAFVRRGGIVVPGQVQEILHKNDVALGVRIEDGAEHHAPVVILAAGVRSQTLLDALPGVAARIPRLISGPGTATLLSTSPTVPPPKSVLRTPNRAFGCGLHMVPRERGLVYVGATNAVHPEAVGHPSVRSLNFLFDCAVRQLRRDLWHSRVVKTMVGNRPIALDGFPLLGRTGLAGLWLMSGTYRDGLHMSPLLAQLMAAWIVDDRFPADLELFQPVRPPIQTMSRDETIRYAVVHRIATGHEFDWSLPVEWPTAIESLLDNHYRTLAQEIDDTFSPLPEVLEYLPSFPVLADMLRKYYTAAREWNPAGKTAG